MRLLALMFIFTTLSWSVHSEVISKVSAHDLALSRAANELRSAGLNAEAKFIDSFSNNKEKVLRFRTLFANFSNESDNRDRLRELVSIFPNDWCSEKQKAYCQLTISYFAVNELESLAL